LEFVRRGARQNRILINYSGVYYRDVNEAIAKCEAETKAEARYHNAEAEVEAKTKKNCEVEAKLCEAEARDAVLTINYTNLNSIQEILQ